MMSETREQVFEALLEAWRNNESALIHEFSSDFDVDHAEADREMEGWRSRFREAKS